MTDEQIEKASQEYVRNNHTVNPYNIIATRESFKDGIIYALSHQWISVEERLPEYNTTCLVFGHQDFGDGSLARYTMMAHYDGENFYDVYDDRKYHPEMWMPIPATPQLNPEKQ